MNIKIEIDCETIGEFTSHLYEIIKEAKKECRKRKLDPGTDEFPKLKWDDANCYGEHYVKIIPEEI